MNGDKCQYVRGSERFSQNCMKMLCQLVVGQKSISAIFQPTLLVETLSDMAKIMFSLLAFSEERRCLWQIQHYFAHLLKQWHTDPYLEKMTLFGVLYNLNR